MMDRRRLIPFLLALVAAAPVATAALWSLSRTAADLSDPCATWGPLSEPGVSTQIGPHDPCRSRSAYGESKARAVTKAALAPGLLLIAAILGPAGAALSRPRLLFTASIVMFFETPVAFTLSPLTLIAAFSFLFLGRRVQGTITQAS
jgi:hypothetical protein